MVTSKPEDFEPQNLHLRTSELY